MLRLNTKTNRGQFAKGHKPWNKNLKGTHFSPETEFKVGQFENEKHPFWKKDGYGYIAIHQWVYRKLGKASFCSFDKSHFSRKFVWANISGSYLRDLDDYVSLCSKCHLEYDLIRSGYLRKDKNGKLIKWLN